MCAIFLYVCEMIAIKRSGFFPSQVNIRINILIPLFLSQLFPNVHKASSNISLEFEWK